MEKLQKSYKVANKVSATYRIVTRFKESAALWLIGANSNCKILVGIHEV